MAITCAKSAIVGTVAVLQRPLFRQGRSALALALVVSMALPAVR